MRPHGSLRGRHQGSEGRWEAMKALSSRPVCSYNSRWLNLRYLSAAQRYTTKRRDGTFFLHVQVKNPVPAPHTPTGTLGVDLGRRRVAVDSDSMVYEATAVQDLRAHSCSFYQLRQFVVYKAQAAGVPVVLIDPAYTSKTCHLCGHPGHRSRLKFLCTRCNVVMDADWNAAMNIAVAGAVVTRLEGAPSGSVKAAGL
jgi:transposase